MANLEPYGWNPARAAEFSKHAAEGCLPARVVVQKGEYEVLSEHGLLRCHPTGRLKFLAEGAQDLPVVGDWVAVKARPGEGQGLIVDVLPRKTRFVRKIPGTRTEAQVIAANIDVAFLISGLDDEFNLARLERYLVLTRESGAAPVLVLNKTDLYPDDAQGVAAIVAESAPGVPIVITSAVTGEGLDQLKKFVGAGVTAALLGSSGVGKSSILNYLLGSEKMKTRDVRGTDSKGRHTTTHRELVMLPSGGMLIDTPGLRELQLWGEGAGLQDAFDDIEQIAVQCKFTNCKHETEPGCAIRTAVEEGRLDSGRLESYRKLQREMSRLQSQYDVRERIANKQKLRKVMGEYKRWKKSRGKP